MAEASGAPAPEQRALDAVLEELRAERDRRKKCNKHVFKLSPLDRNKKRELRRQTLKNAKSDDGATWYDDQVHWKTQITYKSENIMLTSHTFAEKKEAIRLWNEFQQINPASRTNIKKRAADRMEAVADQKTKNVAKHGHQSDLERELLNASVEKVNSTTLVDALVLMKLTTADAVFRIPSMLTENLVKLYIRWQHKTCTNIIVQADKRCAGYCQRMYSFADVMGYLHCLVVFECKSDGAIFVAYGKDINEKHGCNTLQITLSARDVPQLGLKRGDPKLDAKPWLEFLGTGPGARIQLAHRLKEECNRNVLPQCSYAEADAEFMNEHAVEEQGFRYFIQCVFGGIAPNNDPRWNDLPPNMQHKPHIYMLTCKDGDVIAYPEDKQVSKTDLYLYRRAHNYKRRVTMQGKTVHSSHRQNGLHAWLHYEKGDNDLYFMVCWSCQMFHWWIFTEAEMFEHKLIGTGKVENIYVYMTDKPCTKHHRNGHAWTICKHRSMPLPAPSPSQSQASCSTDLP